MCIAGQAVDQPETGDAENAEYKDRRVDHPFPAPGAGLKGLCEVGERNFQFGKSVGFRAIVCLP
jgi:hypothetical protein